MTAVSPRDVNGIAVTVTDPGPTGHATPVLLLHGIGGSSATFAGLTPHLVAAGWRTLAWDAPGYGASAAPGPAVTAPNAARAYVELVAEVLDHLDAVPSHVVGVSWGGVIATCLAQHRPELVASLSLLDSTRGSGVNPTKAAAMRGRIAELAELGGRTFAAGRAHRLPAPGADPSVAAEIERQMAQVRMPGYAGAAEMMAQTDTGPALSTLRVPTLVIVGEHDQVTGVGESELLAERIPGARFAIISDAGHAAVQEQSAAVAAALFPFLTEPTPHPSTPAAVTR